jgi:hypothetical protein
MYISLLPYIVSNPFLSVLENRDVTKECLGHCWRNCIMVCIKAWSDFDLTGQQQFSAFV